MTRTEKIASLYAAMTGKSATDITKGELDAWLNLDESTALETMNASMLAMDGALTYSTGTDSYVKTTFLAVFGYMPDENAEGFAYWVDEIDSGSVSRDNLAIALLNGAAPEDEARAISKVEAAVGNLSAGQEVYLTTGQDVLVGGAGNDTFNGFIFNNSDTAQSGDRIDGGAGEDTLMADMGTSSQFATTISTESVENFQVRAQADNYADNSQNNTGGTGAVEIDAERMNGTDRYESNNSRADVVIEDVRIEPTQITKDITIAMVQTDPGAVDFGVYFDQHSLINAPAESAGAGLDLKVMDITNAIASGDMLLKNPYDKILFELDGVQYELALNTDLIRGSYDQLLQAINDALGATTGLETVSASFNGTFTGIESGTGTETPDGQVITLTTTDDRIFTELGWVASGFLPPSNEFVASMTQTDPSASTFLITSTIILDDVGRGSMGGDLVVGGLSTGATSDSKGVQQFDITVERSSELQEINSTNNTLEEVYIVNGTEKGNLVVAGSTNANPNAIPGDDADSFGFTDVRVLDASAMTGSVNLNAGLSSAVTAKYMNSMDIANTEARDNVEFMYKLGSNNDTLTLAIDSANLAAAGTTTREDFNLTIDGNAGNDTINTQITNFTTGAASNTALNWYANSTSNANLAVNGGAGNDTITTSAGGNFVINGGSGNDTVYADNSGTQTGLILADSNFNGLVDGFDIPVGSSKATYLVNAANTAVTDLVGNGTNIVNTASGVANPGDTLLYKSTVTVTVSGGTTAGTSGVIDGVATANTLGYESTVEIQTTDYVGNMSNVNQAIKEAINSDAVLSKLYIATDGPENALVITSLVDGSFADTDLNIQVNDMGTTAFTALSAGELTGLNTAWETLNQNSLVGGVALADFTNAATDVNVGTTGLDHNEDGIATALESILATDIVAGTTIVGSASAFESDNQIDLGTGDDVAVLGTGALSNDSLVFTGSTIGNNTVVNFDNTAASGSLDTLDFTSYLTNKTSASTSVTSEVRVATTGDNSGVGAHTTAANEVMTINDWTQDVTGTNTETWANMSAADVKAALVSTNAGADDYGTVALADATVDLAANATLVGNSQKQILMIENDLNQGEYKVFELTGDNTTLDYTTVTLLGTVDFGATVDASVALALV